jgi:hypothetical protein
MTLEIAKMLASYLEVPPYQVLTWDRKVIDDLVGNQRTLTAFKQGCAKTRWRIYHSIKYSGSVWATSN